MAFFSPAGASVLFSRFSRVFSTTSSPSFLSLASEGTASSRVMASENGTQMATLAAGCFWGVEHLFRKHFGHGKGLLDAKVGYAGGQTDNPTYKVVCSGTTGRKYTYMLLYFPMRWREIFIQSL